MNQNIKLTILGHFVKNLIELLESEFVDGLGGSHSEMYATTQKMQDIYKNEYQYTKKKKDEYAAFSEYYEVLLKY